MRKKLYIIGNQKMYLDFKSAVKLYEKLLNIEEYPKLNVITCPSMPVLGFISSWQNNYIKLGAQIVSEQELGAYTGQISPKMLKQMNVKYSLVGHSEVRSNYQISDKNANKKILQLLKYKIKPILCIGENKQARSNKDHFKVIKNQLDVSLAKVKLKNENNLLIAYEPIWAIGRSKRMNIDDIVKMHIFIKQYMSKKFKKADWPVLYGGSVNSNNVFEVLSNKYVQGCLLGKAGVNFREFYSIIKIANDIVA